MGKRAAHEEVVALDGLFKGKIAKIRAQAAANSLAAARDLSAASKGMYEKLARNQLEMTAANNANAAAIASYSSKAAAATATAKANMNGALNNRIVRAIQIGEAKARRVANRARVNLAATKKALLIEISERVEATADKLFKTIQGNHKVIADNYLSSLGDLLVNVAAMSSVTAKKAEGIGAGSNTLPAVFTVKNVKVSNSVSKINGLVNEYSSVCNGVRMRWPMGLGKYLLLKLQQSMLSKGVLQVDKVSNHAGNWVFINGRAVGLSNKLNAFESLAVRMGHYEATLAKLIASLSGKGMKN